MQHIDLVFLLSRCLIHVGKEKPKRLPSGILGCLLREYYPGLVKLPTSDEEQPAWTWDHYKLATDNSIYENVAFRVLGEFWVSFFDTLLGNSDRAIQVFY